MMRRLAGLAIIGTLVLGACTGSDEADTRRIRGAPQTPAPPEAPLEPDRHVRAAGELVRFESCDTLLSHLRREALEHVGPWGLQGWSAVHGDVVAMPLAAEAADSGAAARSSAPAAAPVEGTDYSGTNVQEQGVDEPDAVKTDGRRIFSVAGGNLHAIVLDGVAPRVAGSLALPDGWGHELLLAGDRALVFATAPMVMPLARGGAEIAISPGVEGSSIHVVDVTDPASMRIVTTLRLEGSYASARLVDGIARIAVRSPGATRVSFEGPVDGSAAAMRAALQRNREHIAAAGIDSWLPRYTSEQDGRTTEGRLASCESTYHPEGFSGPGTVTVMTVDPADPTPRDTASVLASVETVYASSDNLYIATTRWPEPQPVPLGGTSDDPVAVPEPAPTEPARTELHRFDIGDSRAARYAGSGAVGGTVLNQFSISEHAGHLRVATTQQDLNARAITEPASESSVHVLAVDDGALRNVGSVGGLGRGERIYAVRFLGDVGYVVTFRQIDPLYTLDLRDPADPRVVGELKIPGYSAYLHPVGDGLLLGIGQDATEQGQALGTQVSLFDVSDPAAPERIAQLRFGDAHSQAEFDHHAFLWWARTGLAVVPLQTYGTDGRDGFWAGATGVRVGAERLAEAGRVTHLERSPVQAMIQRSLVIGNALYTVSEAGVLASDLETFADRGWAPYPGP